MKAIDIKTPACLPDEEIAALEGNYLDWRDYDLLVVGDGHVARRDGTISGPFEAINIWKPDGRLLLHYRPNCLPRDFCRAAYDAFQHVDFSSRNRGAAGGIDPETGVLRSPKTKQDGTDSLTTYGNPNQRSGIAGSYDRSDRQPYCRLTAFNAKHAAHFARAVPLLWTLDRAFAEGAPEHHAAQTAAVNAVHPDFRITNTTFSTITVNDTWPTAVHWDDGDFAAGLGVMTVIQQGEYSGGHLVFPKYRVAVDMRTGGACLADVHAEAHGNTPFVGRDFSRMSLVCYLRDKMLECGSMSEEFERAKTLLK